MSLGRVGTFKEHVVVGIGGDGVNGNPSSLRHADTMIFVSLRFVCIITLFRESGVGAMWSM